MSVVFLIIPIERKEILEICKNGDFDGPAREICESESMGAYNEEQDCMFCSFAVLFNFLLPVPQEVTRFHGSGC